MGGTLELSEERQREFRFHVEYIYPVYVYAQPKMVASEMPPYQAMPMDGCRHEAYGANAKAV
jgi:hypothetical protein